MKNFKTKLLTLTLAILMLLSLVACSPEEPETTTVRIYTLNGTTGFGFAKLMNDYTGKTDYEISVQTDPDVVTKALIAGEIDIAALPTNAAANLYKRTNGEIQILAINTLGCFHLLSKNGAITDLSQLAGRTIYTPAQNPYFVTKYLFEQKGIQVTVDSSKYAQPETLKNAVASGMVDYAVLPEPMVTIAKSAAKNQGVTINSFDLASVWSSVSSEKLTIGCIVARKEFIQSNPDAVTKFLTEYKASIEFMNANVEEAAQMIVDQGIFANAAVAKNAIPRCNVVYLDGAEMKTAMHNYISILANISSTYSVPNDGFYYIANQ